MAVMCNDCDFPSRDMTPSSLAKGSTVREPGEPLCEGCSSRRILMVREVTRLPNNLTEIRAKRMVMT